MMMRKAPNLVRPHMRGNIPRRVADTTAKKRRIDAAHAAQVVAPYHESIRLVVGNGEPGLFAVTRACTIRSISVWRPDLLEKVDLVVQIVVAGVEQSTVVTFDGTLLSLQQQSVSVPLAAGACVKVSLAWGQPIEPDTEYPKIPPRGAVTIELGR